MRKLPVELISKHEVFFPLAGLQVVEEYNRREKEMQSLEKEVKDQSDALNSYRLNISEVQAALAGQIFSVAIRR